MATVPATKFKAQCLELMDRVAEGRETYVITKRGKPVAKLVPVDRPRKKSIFGCMADQMEIVGDLEKPLWTDEQWKQFERERAEQWRAAEREWRSTGRSPGRRAWASPSTFRSCAIAGASRATTSR